MKTGIHPPYFPQATVHCSGCNRTFTVGSTKEKTEVELCSNCHPFYTGKQKLVDTAGRVDRFRARQAHAAAKSAPVRADEPATETAQADDSPTPEDRLAEMKKSLEQSGSEAKSSPASKDGQ